MADYRGHRIDLNADLGESFGAWTMGDDSAMLAIVTSASIACGFHAGDASVMLASCRLAVERGVRIGAHVSYNDRAGFGRRTIEMPGSELHADILYQLAALRGIAAVAGGEVSYVKPHGALYNRIVDDPVHAAAVADAVAETDAALPILGLAGSTIATAAKERGLRLVPEAFADRAYASDGRLVPRGQAGSVLHDADEIAERALRITIEGTVIAIDGSTVVAVDADSLCVHGDTSGAVAIARAVRGKLERSGIHLAAFN